MLRFILIIIFIWIGWIGYQYYDKSSLATILSDKKTEEFYATDTEILLKQIKQGPQKQVENINGKKFWLSWSLQKTNDNNIELDGRTDFIEIFPFSDLKVGHHFKSRLQIKN
ncbi:MAG: hypothetical protein MUF05_02535 [Candidatus Omnitrophica bacterium]|jgi:hypothetical protein|nr:hypothetical protein [Candidatus Omnitrophota bacterium]